MRIDSENVDISKSKFEPVVKIMDVIVILYNIRIIV